MGMFLPCLLISTFQHKSPTCQKDVMQFGEWIKGVFEQNATSKCNMEMRRNEAWTIMDHGPRNEMLPQIHSNRVSANCKPLFSPKPPNLMETSKTCLHKPIKNVLQQDMSWDLWALLALLGVYHRHG